MTEFIALFYGVDGAFTSSVDPFLLIIYLTGSRRHCTDVFRKKMWQKRTFIGVRTAYVFTF